MDEVIVGKVTHYFHRIAVAVVEVAAAELRVGDTIRVLGATSNFTQPVRSMEIDHTPVDVATTGEQVAVHVAERARVNDLVFRISPHAHINGVSIGTEQGPAS